MSAGLDTVCAVHNDGSIACNRLAFPEGEVFNQVAAGHDMGCAERLDGTASCWTSEFDQRPPPYQDMAQIDAGLDHFCGLTRDYEIECWDDRGDDAWDPVPAYRSISDPGPLPLVLPGRRIRILSVLSPLIVNRRLYLR